MHSVLLATGVLLLLSGLGQCEDNCVLGATLVPSTRGLATTAGDCPRPAAIPDTEYSPGMRLRLQVKNPSWSAEKLERVVHEYLRYIALILHQNRGLAPSEDVDEAWHNHVLFTRQYIEFSRKYNCGEYIHHQPSFNSDGGRPGAFNLAIAPDQRHYLQHAAFNKTLDAYRHMYGTEPPHDEWQIAAQCCGDDDAPQPEPVPSPPSPKPRPPTRAPTPRPPTRAPTPSRPSTRAPSPAPAPITPTPVNCACADKKLSVGDRVHYTASNSQTGDCRDQIGSNIGTVIGGTTSSTTPLLVQWDTLTDTNVGTAVNCGNLAAATNTGALCWVSCDAVELAVSTPPKVPTSAPTPSPLPTVEQSLVLSGLSNVTFTTPVQSAVRTAFATQLGVALSHVSIAQASIRDVRRRKLMNTALARQQARLSLRRDLAASPSTAVSCTMVVIAVSATAASTMRNSLATQTRAELQHAIRTEIEVEGLSISPSSISVISVGTPTVLGVVTTTTAPAVQRVHELNVVAGITFGACFGFLLLGFAFKQRNFVLRHVCGGSRKRNTHEMELQPVRSPRSRFTPPKDRAGLQEPQSHLLQLERHIAAAPASSDISPTQLDAIGTCVKKIWAVLDSEMAAANLALLHAVANSEGRKHAKAYAACHDIVRDDAGYDDLLNASRSAQAQFPGVHDGRRTCQQPVHTLSALYAHARQTLPRFADEMRLVVAAFAELIPDKRGKPPVVLQLSPLKHLYRCAEKMCFKTGDTRYQCESVCDVVRCIVECADCSLMAQVLQAILDNPRLMVRRVKDRANTLTSMNWMDVMVNVTVAGDEYKHVCEVQIVHSKMLLARSGLGGHEPYANLRAAAEMAEVIEWMASRVATKLPVQADGKQGIAVQNPLQVEITNPGIDTVREERATTEYSVEQRQRNNGSSLIAQRIEVQGRGAGVVLNVVKSRGKATKHLIMFDDGKRETVLLSKGSSSTNTRANGRKFWLLHDTVQVRAEPSRSQC